MKIFPWLTIMITTSCATPSPHFETSLHRLPEQTAADRAPTPPSPDRLRLIPSEDEAEEVTNRFFRLLSTGNLAALGETLDSSAMLMIDQETSRRPAAASLSEIYASLSGRAPSAGFDASTSPLFAPVRVVQVKQNLGTTTVQVFVSSPPDVHGVWIISMRNTAPGLPISLITLPRTR